MKKGEALLLQYKEQLAYLFFGVLTTVLNYAVFWLFQQAWQGRHVLFANLLTCLIATAFAYVTNKVFVFHSPAWHPGFVLREALAFLSGRLFSFGIEEAGLYVAAYVLRLDRFSLWGLDGTMLSKIVVSFLAVLVFWSAFLSTSSPEAFF
ncbi:GtrA family protein [Neglecta sp. X4]|uniref:GtrA family protein n=1 Tax=unclassified Neglectibacter TaxID=2632164 RepID=UPI0013BAFEA2|nr:GtrA family protein [Neglectibacter sp. 59]NBJ74697.1 GtrA family protein [Neglectibacter sp. X4]NCE82228.1 GtrA family protein [Neglectibacter sp. X58]